MGLPSIPQDLLEYLKKLYPDCLPSHPLSDLNDLNFRAGQLSVVRKLEDLKKQLEEEHVSA